MQKPKDTKNPITIFFQNSAENFRGTPLTYFRPYAQHRLWPFPACFCAKFEERIASLHTLSIQ